MSSAISKDVNIWWFLWSRIITPENPLQNGFSYGSQLTITICWKRMKNNLSNPKKLTWYTGLSEWYQRGGIKTHFLRLPPGWTKLSKWHWGGQKVKDLQRGGVFQARFSPVNSPGWIHLCNEKGVSVSKIN